MPQKILQCRTQYQSQVNVVRSNLETELNKRKHLPGIIKLNIRLLGFILKWLGQQFYYNYSLSHSTSKEEFGKGHLLTHVARW